MMEHIVTYIILFGLIVIVGQVFHKSTIPISLLLVITGILLSFIPGLPQINLNPEVVLNIFLPLLIYQISSFSSWKDIKKNIQPIILLSIGHVIFITILVAIVMHTLIPELDWPLAFVLGAVISPPDDVAIVSIAENVRMPEKIITILEGEAIFNDATALILFRFALAAAITHQFSASHAFMYLILVLIGETIYGLCLGYFIGELRLRINNPILHMIASLLTPFLAYVPVELMGGSGILATAIAGFIIGNRYAVLFTPEFRLYSRSLWPTIAYIIQSILFLLVGLNMGFILESVSTIPTHSLILYSSAVIATVIVGRFFWVFVIVAYLPKFSLTKRSRRSFPPWQYPFVISWAGMRGGISLAAALAVPTLPLIINGAAANNLLLFLVICVIAITFILQGLTLPWLIKILGLVKHGDREAYDEHIAELNARMQMTRAVLRWLSRYKQQIEDPKLTYEIKLYTREYRMLRDHLKENINNHDDPLNHDEEGEVRNEVILLSQIIEIERNELLTLWHNEKINLRTRNKLLDRLDHRIRHLSG